MEKILKEPFFIRMANLFHRLFLYFWKRKKLSSVLFIAGLALTVPAINNFRHLNSTMYKVYIKKQRLMYFIDTSKTLQTLADDETIEIEIISSNCFNSSTNRYKFDNKSVTIFSVETAWSKTKNKAKTNHKKLGTLRLSEMDKKDLDKMFAYYRKITNNNDSSARARITVYNYKKGIIIKQRSCIDNTYSLQEMGVFNLFHLHKRLAPPVKKPKALTN
ncbi:MAG: hypothetical protein HRT89_02920 [Lentisphaeria bacterium]|nr:hypothetical protein [Lentisphaeria bacterium]NQZ67001.1 hypothetical protein [Lentisphaeria bacterium]